MLVVVCGVCGVVVGTGGGKEEKGEGGRCVTGDHLFIISATCSVLSWFAVNDCHSPFSVVCIALCSGNCLAQGQPVSLHS